jgi:hypothetical protein
MRTTAHFSVRLAVAALALAPLARAHELKDVSLIAAGGKAHLKLAFAAAPGETEYPLYFQKGEPAKGVLTLSFLETGTSFALGRHALDADAPEVEEITLKKITSPSGKNFLGVELKLRAASYGVAGSEAAAVVDGSAEVLTMPKGVLKVQLGDSPIPKYEWSLAKASQSGDAYLSAKAAPAPKALGAKSKAAKAAAAAEREAAAVFSAPLPSDSAAAASEPAAAKPAAVPGKVGAAAAKPGPASANAGAASAPATSASGPEKADPVTSAHADGMAFEKSRGGAAAGAVGNGTGSGGTGKSLSSSRTFMLGRGGKTLVMIKDSAALKSEPGEAGKAIRKIPIGEKVDKIESKGGSMRVAAGQDTGWIRSWEAVYEDELTAAQEKGIQGKIASNQARMEAAQARVAAAQAKEAEKKRKAEEAAAEAQRKLAEKQAAQEAKLAAAKAKEEEKKRKAEEAAAAAAAEAQRKLAEKQAALEAKRQAAASAAAAAAAKANPPADIREAGAAPNRTGQPQAAANPAQPAGAGSPAMAQAAPKLGLADNPELANKLAQEKLAAEEEKKRIEPEENRVTYNSYGRRDPFIPVEQGVTDNGIDIDQMKVVGIIWQSSQPMAVLEHNREAGVSFTVKEGDPVHNGRVSRISHEAVTFDISEYGISRSYSLRLVSSSAKEGAKR